MDRSIFEDLFVLELANNHLGKLERGLKIIHEFAAVVREHKVKATIKLQFRDHDHFVHKDHRDRQDLRYVKKTMNTRLAPDDFAAMNMAIRGEGLLTSATPFDEQSVELCRTLHLDIIKVASSDINDWPLLEAIARANKPVVASTGGASLADIDTLVKFFDMRGIPLAINHCVSLYPSEDCELELNQIDLLRERYPGHVIGFSTHEYQSWDASMFISYAKGARMWERHVDIVDDFPKSPYCSSPRDIAAWFRAYRRAKTMCGGPSSTRHNVSTRERQYLDSLLRGVYARYDLREGEVVSPGTSNSYMAIPLQRGQLSCREMNQAWTVSKPVQADEPLTCDNMAMPYSVREELNSRGHIEVEHAR